jgi:Holliday junction resolvase
MGVTSPGVPDLNGCCKGIEFWIECKAADHWRIKYRYGQVGWIERRLAAGGRVFVAVRRARTELWLFHGEAARRLVDERLDEVEALGHWDKGPARWDWLAIARLLTE